VKGRTLGTLGWAFLDARTPATSPAGVFVVRAGLVVETALPLLGGLKGPAALGSACGGVVETVGVSVDSVVVGGGAVDVVVVTGIVEVVEVVGLVGVVGVVGAVGVVGVDAPRQWSSFMPPTSSLPWASQSLPFGDGSGRQSLPLLPCEHGPCPGGAEGGPAARTDVPPPASAPNASTSGAANQMSFFMSFLSSMGSGRAPTVRNRCRSNWQARRPASSAAFAVRLRSPGGRLASPASLLTGRTL
jgi:hypothetical protein